MIEPRSHRERVVSSMLWSAWADAVGFISELTDERGLIRRSRGQPLDRPFSWKRRVGGRMGPDVELPPGCYSDDTQLRLATARAIGGQGFDVEAFARVELTVWPAYALGGGKATKKAVANLAKPRTLWSANFYEGWDQAGGNGVAMRIQPHVWAAHEPASLGPHLVDVLRNGITTHGHPRALVGAVLHAVALGVTLDTGEVPTPDTWRELLDMTDRSVKLLVEAPGELGVWLAHWEQANNVSFGLAWSGVVDECRDMLSAAAATVRELRTAAPVLHPQAAYGRFVEEIGLGEPATRGSGTATTVAALALAAASAEEPSLASLLAANALGTDTDTIATMAAAIVGAATPGSEPTPLLDSTYLRREAERLASVAVDQSTPSFRYPDLLTWVPPRTQLDAVGRTDGRLALAGLAWLEPIGPPPEIRGDTVWIWMRSDIGASFLVKHRREPRDLPPPNWPVHGGDRATRAARQRPEAADQLPLGDTASVSLASHEERDDRQVRLRGVDVRPRQPTAEVASAPIKVDVVLQWLKERGFAHEAIGYAMEQVAERGSLEQMIAFTAAVRAELLRRR